MLPQDQLQQFMVSSEGHNYDSISVYRSTYYSSIRYIYLFAFSIGSTFFTYILLVYVQHCIFIVHAILHIYLNILFLCTLTLCYNLYLHIYTIIRCTCTILYYTLYSHYAILYATGQSGDRVR